MVKYASSVRLPFVRAPMFSNTPLSQFDPQLAQAIANEDARQEAHIELIASETIVRPW